MPRAGFEGATMSKRPLTLAGSSWLVPVLSVALLICTGAACGRERILSFDSRIALHRDGTALIQETIRVASAGEQMRSGIHRDIPTAYWDRFLLARDMGVRLVSVRRDGRPEPHDVETSRGSLRVYLGGRYPNLSAGRYTYTLTYSIRDPLRSSLTRDALAMDITGHAWSYSIDAASALIILPPGVPAASVRCRCATLRAPKQGGCDGRLDSSGRVLIRTSAELRARDGLIADISWPRGYVALPSPAERLLRTAHDNIPICYGLIGLLAVTAYYLLVWWITRRYTPPSTVDPVTDPPDATSHRAPCTTCTLWDMAAGGTCSMRSQQLWLTWP